MVVEIQIGRGIGIKPPIFRLGVWLRKKVRHPNHSTKEDATTYPDAWNGQGLVSSLWLSGELGDGAIGQVYQWGNIIKLPWVRTVASRYHHRWQSAHNTQTNNQTTKLRLLIWFQTALSDEYISFFLMKQPSKFVPTSIIVHLWKYLLAPRS